MLAISSCHNSGIVFNFKKAGTDSAAKGLGSGISFDGNAVIMIGSTAPHLADLKKAAADMPFTISWHIDEDDPAQLMFDTDLALGASGGTVWERCCLGLASVIVVTAGNQDLIAQNLADAGAAALIALDKGERIQTMAEIIYRMTMNLESILTMSRKAARICDGLGASRVAETI